MDYKKILDNIVEWLSSEGLKIGIGLILTFISFKLINFIVKRVEKRMNKRNVDKIVQNAIVSVSRKTLKALVIIMLLGYLGIETSSIAAAVTSLGIGVGLALQGSLSNVAGGIILILTRPFKIGDFIEALGVSGTVEYIGMYYTNIVTPDNKAIELPNGSLSNGVITNYSRKTSRRLDMTFSIAYEADFVKAKNIILDCIKRTNLAFDTPEPFVNINKHNASSIELIARLWCDGKDYWTIYYKLLELVKVEFDQNRIVIPYDQLDVFIKNK